MRCESLSSFVERDSRRAVVPHSYVAGRRPYPSTASANNPTPNTMR